MCFVNQYLAEEMGYRKNHCTSGIEPIPVARFGENLGNTLGAAVYAHIATPYQPGRAPFFEVQIPMTDSIHFVGSSPLIHKQAAVETTLVLSLHRVKVT